jgi:MFS transporter, PPP family, 3-phenylpropionic acid transporter
VGPKTTASGGQAFRDLTHGRVGTKRRCAALSNKPLALNMTDTPIMRSATAADPLTRFLALYALLYAAFGVSSPFLPAFIETRGISVEDIGLIFAAGTALRLFSAALVGRLADRLALRRETLAACAIVAAVAALLYLPAAGLSAIVMVSLVHAIALAPLTALADALALVAAFSSFRGRRPAFEYGWVRGTGSAAFIVGSLAVGATILSSGVESILWLQAILLMAVPFAARLVPDDQRAAMIPPAELVTRENMRTLLGNVRFRRVVLVAALVLGSHAMHDTFSVIRWSAAGLSAMTASLLWSLSVAAEVVVFLLIGPRLLRILSPAGAIAIAALAGTVRWSVAAITADVTALLLIQPLHGLTFALLHLACMRLLAQSVPAGLAATAQAIYGVAGVGAASATLTFASGWLYGKIGPTAFAAMSLLCLAALPLAIKLRQSGEKGLADPAGHEGSGARTSPAPPAGIFAGRFPQR